MQLTDEIVANFEKARVFKDYNDRYINSLDFHRSEDKLVAAGDDDWLHIYDTQNGSAPKKLQCRKYGVGCVRFTHSPDAVIHTSTRGPDQWIRYLSTHDNSYLRYFKGHESTVTSLCMSPRSDTFLSAAQDTHVRLWDLRTEQCQGLLKAPGPPCAEFDQQGAVFCVAIDCGVMKLYDSRSFEKGPFISFAVHGEENSPTPLTGIRFSNDGKLLSAVAGGKLHVIDSFEGTTLATLHTGCPEGAPPFQPTFTPDSQYILSGCEDRTIKVWSCKDLSINPTPVAVWIGHGERPTCLQWSPRKAIAASACKALALWLPNQAALQSAAAAAAAPAQLA